MGTGGSSVALFYCRDTVCGSGGEPCHQQLPHRPEKHRKCVTPSTNIARATTNNISMRATNKSPSPAPKTTEQRLATPIKSPPLDTTCCVKGLGQKRFSRNISRPHAPPQHHARANTIKTSACWSMTSPSLVSGSRRQRPATLSKARSLRLRAGSKGGPGACPQQKIRGRRHQQIRPRFPIET